MSPLQSQAAVLATEEVTALVFLMVKVASLTHAQPRFLVRSILPGGLGAPLVVCIEPKAREDQIQQHLSTCGQTFVQVEPMIDGSPRSWIQKIYHNLPTTSISLLKLRLSMCQPCHLWLRRNTSIKLGARVVGLCCALRGHFHVVGRCQLQKGSELPSLSR